MAAIGCVDRGARRPHPTPLPAPSSRAPRWFICASAIALLGYAALLGWNMSTAAGGSDSSGYLNSARLLTTGALETPIRLPESFRSEASVVAWDFQPLGFAALDNTTRLVPTYASGVPLMFAGAAAVLGWTWGPWCVGVAGALCGVWLGYAVARELGLDRTLAATAAIVLAACPLTIFAAIQPLSDMPATTWVLAAFWGVLRARRHARWAALGGAAFGIAVLVRQTDALVLPALLVLLGCDRRGLGWFVLGGIPAAGWMAYYNHTLYGGPLRSGYFEWSDFFGAEYFKPAIIYFARTLAVLLPAALLVLPLFAVWRSPARRELCALGLWFFALTGLYAFCAFSHEAWTTLRYLLPALPALIFAALLGAEAYARGMELRKGNRLRASVAGLVALWAIGISADWLSRKGVFWVKHYEEAYRDAAHEARARFSKNALVLCCHHSGSLYFYTDFPVLRWDSLTPQTFANYAALAQRAGVPLTALLFAEEEQGALREQCPGEWMRLATVGNVSLWRLASAARPAE